MDYSFLHNISLIMVLTLWYWITHISLGDILGILSLIITLVGFSLTFKQIDETKRKVSQITGIINLVNSASELSYTVSQLEELTDISGTSNWSLYAGKSVIVCAKLSSFSQHPDAEKYREKIAEILESLQETERVVRVALQKDKLPNKREEITKLLIVTRDSIGAILADIKIKAGNQ